MTPLEETFGINNVVLVDGVPTTLGLYDLCSHYVDHRLDVIVRRTQYRLERAQARLHIVDGLLIALDNIDLVIAIIRGSDDVAEARRELMEPTRPDRDPGDAHPRHAAATPDRARDAEARRRSATSCSRRIDDYTGCSASETRQRTVVLNELAELVDEYGRRTPHGHHRADDIAGLPEPRRRSSSTTSFRRRRASSRCRPRATSAAPRPRVPSAPHPAATTSSSPRR